MYLWFSSFNYLQILHKKGAYTRIITGTFSFFFSCRWPVPGSHRAGFSTKLQTMQHVMFYPVELSYVSGKEPGLFAVTAAKICNGFLLYDVNVTTFLTTWTYEYSNAETIHRPVKTLSVNRVIGLQFSGQRTVCYWFQIIWTLARYRQNYLLLVEKSTNVIQLNEKTNKIELFPRSGFAST